MQEFGTHMLKSGSVVIPGNIAFDGQFYAVKLNAVQSGVDVSLYVDELVGKTYREIFWNYSKSSESCSSN